MSRGTTLRAVRVPDDLWGAALHKAEKEHTSVSEVIRHLLAVWVEGLVEI